MEAPQCGRLQWASAVADRLWSAWCGLQSWEDAVDDEMGDRLGDVVLLLWAVHRFAGVEGGEVILDSVLDGEVDPVDRDPVLHDLVQVAFAMGASWASSRGDSNGAAPPRPPHLHIVSGDAES